MYEHWLDSKQKSHNWHLGDNLRNLNVDHMILWSNCKYLRPDNGTVVVEKTALILGAIEYNL